MSEKLADARKASDQPAPFTNKNDPDRRIPERQVYSGNENFSWELGGRNIKMTGGFMEPYGHGRKTSSTLYLDSKNPDPKNPAVRTPSRYNIGIDYVVGGDQQVTPWYVIALQSRPIRATSIMVRDIQSIILILI
jgi:hypothetical protein